MSFRPSVMHPLPTHTVDLVLQYISHLTDPLPPHLISLPLHHRHHFLQISPASPVDYLCWPSPDNHTAIVLLDSLHPLSGQASYPTRYTSDSESTFAHAQVSSDAHGLRVIFHWDDGWKYHDLRLMPFPSPSFSAPQESHASNSACAAGPPSPPSLDLFAEADRNEAGSDGSYWDAYGVGEHGSVSPLALPGESMSGTAEGEDAYWARYAVVQGSADSTIPSPLPINRKPRYADPDDDASTSRFPPQVEPVIDVPVNAIHSRPLPSMLGPPSPNMLTDLLSTISLRRDTYSSILDDPCPLQSPSAYSSDLSPGQTATDSEVITPPLGSDYLDATVVSPDQVSVARSEYLTCPLNEAEDKALTDSIRGLYCLWKAGRKGELNATDRSIFLRAVQAAIPYE